MIHLSNIAANPNPRDISKTMYANGSTVLGEEIKPYSGNSIEDLKIVWKSEKKEIETLKQLIEKIDGFSQLAPNWDSYDAEPISKTPIKEAKKFLKKLHKANQEIFSISPMACDGVMIQVKNEKKRIEFSFYEGDTSDYYAYLKGGKDYDEGELSKLKPNSFKKLLSWLNS